VYTIVWRFVSDSWASCMLGINVGRRFAVEKPLEVMSCKCWRVVKTVLFSLSGWDIPVNAESSCWGKGAVPRLVRMSLCRQPTSDARTYGNRRTNTRLSANVMNYAFAFQPQLVLMSPTQAGWKAETTYLSDYIPRWFTRPNTVTHPSTNRAHRWLTLWIRPTMLTTTQCDQPDR